MVPYIAKTYSPSTVELLAQVDQAFEELVSIAPDEVKGDMKTMLLALFTSLAMEHFRAIVLCVKSRVAIGSVFALLRPLLESIVRGEWLYLCGTEADRDAFMRSALHFKGLRNLAKDVDEEVRVGPWLSTWSESYTHFCDFTHGGPLPLA